MEKISKDELLAEMKLADLNDEDLELVAGGLTGTDLDKCISRAYRIYKSCVTICKSRPAENYEQCKSECKNKYLMAKDDCEK